jgi:hypothetical protein
LVIFKKFELLENELQKRYGVARDPWGLEPKRAVADIKAMFPFYEYYFNVKVHGKNMS